MTDDLWTRLADLVPEALALPAAERDAFLDAACRRADGTPDPALRAEAAALVAAAEDAEAADALRSPLAPLADAAPDADGVPEEPVGPWRLTGRLGEGGMGVVYRAERADGLFTREVALKRLHPAHGRALAGRLDAERRTLARLEHDGIARLYDGGVDADGAPYLVMELVDGAPITAYADAERLGTADRVALFVRVCEAVAYAHRHLVVHRDLKPSNVFVTAAGGVKLLDFGIAKLLDEAGGPDAEPLTRTHAALTPSYAAPEQLRRGDVTTATDVYALGVMLYELLAGRRPYTLSTATAAEAERLVCETDPPPMSAVAPPERARALRGDLDTVVAKALAKEPARRYASADAFADDLRRHLDGLPVRARPATWGYRARRFAARHRVAVGAAAAVAVALVTGAAVAVAQAREARAQSARATAMNEFLVGLLGAPDPTGADGRDVRVATLLDRAAAALDSTFAGEPDTEAAMRHALGVTYRELGLYDESARELTGALALRERRHGPRDRDVLTSQNALGELWLLQSRLGPADSLLTRALAAARGVYDAHDSFIGAVLGNLAYVRFLTGDYEASLAMHRETVEIARAQPEPDSVEVAAGLGNVAVVLLNLGRPAEAAAIQERQVATYRAALDPGNTRIARVLDNLGSTYYSLGRYDDALRASTEAIAIFRNGVGATAELANALGNASPILLALDRPAEAEAAVREALTHYEATVGTAHPRYAGAVVKLGQTLQAAGRTAEAEAALRRAVGLFQAAVPAEHPALANARAALGELLATTGRAPAAVPLLRDALAARTAALPEGHPTRAVSASLLGDALRRTGDLARAESLLVAAHADLARAAAEDPSVAERAADAAGRLADLRAAQGRPAEATRLRAPTRPAGAPPS